MKHLIKKHSFHRDACTQFSIAMAYGLELLEVAEDLRWSPVSTAELRNYLVRKGLSATGDSVEDVRVIAEGKGLIIIQGINVGHAMAYEDGTIYDPNGHTFKCILDATDYYSMHTGKQWEFYTLFKAEPIKYRPWNVGKTKEEAK